MALKNSQINTFLYTADECRVYSCTPIRKGKEEDEGNWENERRNEESLQMSEDFGKQSWLHRGWACCEKKNFSGSETLPS